jgi:hypothetical protein
VPEFRSFLAFWWDIVLEQFHYYCHIFSALQFKYYVLSQAQISLYSPSGKIVPWFGLFGNLTGLYEPCFISGTHILESHIHALRRTIVSPSFTLFPNPRTEVDVGLLFTEKQLVNVENIAYCMPPATVGGYKPSDQLRPQPRFPSSEWKNVSLRERSRRSDTQLTMCIGSDLLISSSTSERLYSVDCHNRLCTEPVSYHVVSHSLPLWKAPPTLAIEVIHLCTTTSLMQESNSKLKQWSWIETELGDTHIATTKGPRCDENSRYKCRIRDFHEALFLERSSIDVRVLTSWW